MAMEPITIFSRIADLAKVARKLRELVPSVEFDGSEDAWKKAIVNFKKWWRKQTLTFNHDPEYCAEPNWSNQMAGMRGYFSQLPDSDRKSRAQMLTTSFRLSLGTLFQPDFNPNGDPRLDVLFALTEALDGVLFTPSSLRDAHGRILLSAGEEDDEDPEAVWPRVAASVSIANPREKASNEASQPKQPDQDQEDEELDPPSAQRVAKRAIALTAVTARAILEQDIATPDAQATHRDLLAWVEDTDIKDELEPDEWEVLQRPLGRLDKQQQINSTWRLEGLVVLAWALGRFEIPAYDQLVELHPLWHSLGILDSHQSRLLVENASLRPRSEISLLCKRLFALHWRLRNYHLNHEVMNFSEFASNCWFGPLDISGMPLIENDLAIQGERIDRAQPDSFASAHSSAKERHQAANWLWEGPERFSDASVST